MSLTRVGRAVARWVRRARKRRRARLASLAHVDEQLVAESKRADEEGAPYDTWRRTLPEARRGAGGGI